MELALAVLLISSFSCVGLLALWAANSTYHWLLRTATLFGPIALLLLIPAYEPYAILVVEGCLNAIAVLLHRALFRRQDKDQSSIRFTLLDMLCMTTALALMLPIALILIRTDEIHWYNVLLLSVTSAICVLLAVWCAANNSCSWILKAAIGLFVIALLPWLLFRLEPSLLMSIDYVDEWFAIGIGEVKVNFWSIVTTFTFLIVLLLLVLYRGSENSLRIKIVGFGLLLVIASPSTYIYYRLLTPTPIPAVKPLENNSYRDLVAAGKELDIRLVNFWDETPITQLKDAVFQHQAAYQKADLALIRPARVPINYDFDDVDTDAFMALRTLCNAYFARARVSLDDDKLDQAVDDYLRVLRLGHQVRNGGLLVNWLVGVGIEGSGQHQLYQIHTKLNAEQCREVIEAYSQIIESIDSLDAILLRERIWCEHAYGVYGHLSVILDDLTKVGNWDDRTTYDVVATKEEAAQNLLLTALAIQGYSNRHGELPVSLDMLVPSFLKQVPSDPFDPNGKSLQYYKLSEHEFQLYSIGANNVDDGGIPPDLDENELTDWETGDIVLHDIYAPWEPVEDSSGDDPVWFGGFDEEDD